MISRYVGCSIPLQFYDKIVKEACIQIIPGIFANQIGAVVSLAPDFFSQCLVGFQSWQPGKALQLLKRLYLQKGLNLFGLKNQASKSFI